MQYDFNLRPVDFVGQYMRGKTFREEMEELKRKRQDTEEAKAMLKQKEADALAERELIQDMRIANYYMDNGMYDQALAHTDQRMQRLSQQGRDVSDTGEIYNLMRSGDYITSHGMLKAGLAGLGQLQEKSKGDSPKVGRFRTERVGDKMVMYDSATSDVVKEWDLPKSQKEAQEIRKLTADANKAETQAELAVTLADDEETKKIKQSEMALETAQLAESILSNPNLDKITGTVDARTYTIRKGSQDAVNDALRLESMLTVDNLKLMSGVLTDRDIKFLTRVGSGLNITDNGIKGSEKAVRKRLTEIANKIRASVGPVPPSEKEDEKDEFEGFSIVN